MKEQRCHCSDKHKHYRWDASQPPAANPWNTCRAGPRFGPEFLSCGSKRRAGLAVFVCVSAPALLPVALRCQPAHRPPVRPVEHSPAATAQHRHPSDWGFLLDWLKCLLFSTLLEFNTSLFTGPHVAPVSLSPPPPFFVHVFSPFPQHTFFIWRVYPPFTQSTHTAHLWGGILAYSRRSTRYLMWRKSHWSVWGWLVVFILYYKNNHVFKWINNFISLE